VSRILVADRPSPMVDAVRAAISGESDLEVDLAFGTDVELMLCVAEIEADLVVVSMSDRTAPPLVERLLDEHPGLTVVALDVDRAEALVQTVAADADLIEHMSGRRLAEVLRSAAT
jgi:DNA-binding NarL/FixJ family response regulator